MYNIENNDDVSFYSIDPIPTQDCSICLIELDNDVYVHDGEDGEKHPFHKTCIKQWVAKKPTCPNCHKNINSYSLLTTSEKTIYLIKSAYIQYPKIRKITEICTGIIIGIGAEMLKESAQDRPKLSEISTLTYFGTALYSTVSNIVSVAFADMLSFNDMQKSGIAILTSAGVIFWYLS